MVYLLRYGPAGAWVERDDSTGPMSTGGYPMQAKDIRSATLWHDKAKALKYAHTCKDIGPFVLFEYEIEPKQSKVSQIELAQASEDKEYLEYLRLAEKYGVEIPELKCKFNMAWRGICEVKTVVGKEYCAKHLGEKCFSCGKQATRDCDHTSQFVCGMPMCDEHRHTHGGGY